MQKNERIEIERDYDQIHWSLPVRDLGEYSQYGWFIVAFGAFTFLFISAWVAAPLCFGVGMIAQGEWLGWVAIAFSMFGISFLIFGARILVLGCLVIKNRTRSEVQISKGKLISIEKLGWFDWRRKIKINDIREFQIKDSSRMGKERGGQFTDAWKALVAKTDKKEFMVAMGYSDELVNELARHLSTEIGKEVGVHQVQAEVAKAGKAASKGGVPIRDETDKDFIPEKPVDTKIVVHDQGEQLAYEIPAQGYKGLAGGMLFFALIWNSFCVFFLIASLTQGFDGEFVVGMIFISVFLLVGIFLLVYSINLAKRSVMIGVLGDQMFIERKSIFGVKWMEFAITDIRGVYVGNSNMEVNDKPVRELKIQTNEGKERGLLYQLAEPELEWLAYHLSQAMGVSRSIVDEEITWQSEVGKLDDLQLPKGSPIRINEKVDGVRIRVPMKIRTLIVPVFMGIFSICAGVLIGSPWGDAGIMGMMFGAVFGFAGLFITLVSIEFCTRRFVFEVDGRMLNARRSSVLSKKLVQWHRDDIQSIDIGASNVRTNGKEVYQLQIRADGKSFNGMTSWSVPELAVVAGLLNQSLDRR